MEDVVDNLDASVSSADTGPMSDRLFDQISRAIISGTLAPGESITEPELARRYGVSRAPLREALRRLEERQLLERSPYRGMRVVEPSSRMIRELYEIREVLEGFACRRAAENADPDDIEALRRTLADEATSISARDAAQAGRAGSRQVLTFHALIARISGNDELLRLLNNEIWRLFRADYWRRAHRPETIGQGHKEHMQIFEAISARDSDLSDLLMRRHIANTRRLREETLVVG